MIGEKYQVQVGRHGVITIPKQLREQSNLVDGDIFTLIELSSDVFVLRKKYSQIDDVADKLAGEWRNSGESLESMLKTLREARSEYDKKKP